MSLPNWTPPLTKLRVYEAFYLLNRSFEATINAADRLERLEFFEGDALSTLKSRLEYIRAETNGALVENVAEYEQDEAFRFDQIVRKWEKENRDPDDVFFEARDRKQEIKQKMKELQAGLGRQRIKRKSSRRRSSKRKPSRNKSVTRNK